MVNGGGVKSGNSVPDTHQDGSLSLQNTFETIKTPIVKFIMMRKGT